MAEARGCRDGGGTSARSEHRFDFAALAALGFKKRPWFVVPALIGHGLFDVVHPHAIENGGVPLWWPDFCSAYDVTAGVWRAWRLRRVRPRAV